MGSYAARCMCDRNVGEPDMNNFFFELFAHATQFLGHKVGTCVHFVYHCYYVKYKIELVSMQVIFLGRFNGQGLSTELTSTMNEYLNTARSSIASGTSGDASNYVFLKSK